MYYTGIDYHKRYSVACTLDAQGRKIREVRIDANAPAAFAAYFRALDQPTKVTMEACWNWGVLHDLLETLGNVAEVILSNPAKNRIIAESKNSQRGHVFCHFSSYVFAFSPFFRCRSPSRVFTYLHESSSKMKPLFQRITSEPYQSGKKRPAPS
jgi:hypothetical protein